MTTILVTGATGNVGHHVVRQLATRDVTTRALVRDPAAAAARFGVHHAEVEILRGDLDDPSSIRSALAGVDRLFLTAADGPSKVAQEQRVIDLAAAAGVELIVKLSAMHADERSALPAFAWHGTIERHLAASGVPAVVLQPAFFMANMLMVAPGVAATDTLFAPTGGAKVAMVDVRDVAAVAAAVLVDPGLRRAHAGGDRSRGDHVRRRRGRDRRRRRPADPLRRPDARASATSLRQRGRAAVAAPAPRRGLRADPQRRVRPSHRHRPRGHGEPGHRHRRLRPRPRRGVRPLRLPMATTFEAPAGTPVPGLAPPPQRRMTAAQRGTLLAVCLATAMLMLDIAVVNTALSAIATDLDTGGSGLQWVIDAYTLPLAALVVTAGSLADRFGRRRLFLLGLVVFTAASACCAAAPSIAVLDAARAVQGVGAAVMFAVSLAVLSVAFPHPAQRMPALAAYGATMAASFAIGPLVGGALTTAWGWPSIFLINLPLGVITIMLVQRSVGESTDPRATGVDWLGLVTLSGGLFFLVVALLRGNEDGWSSAVVTGSFVAAGVLLAAFVVVELRDGAPDAAAATVPQPALHRRPTGRRRTVGIAVRALWLSLTLYLQQVLGMSAVAAGLVFLPGTLVNLFVASAMSSLGRRASHPARTIAVGSTFVAGGLLLLVLVSTETSWWWFLPGLLVAMVGTGALNPTVSAVALDALPPEQSGLAAGVNDMFRQAGIAVGIAAYGAIAPIDLAFQPARHGDFVEYLYDALWVGAAVALVCGLVASRLVARAVHDRRSEGEVMSRALDATTSAVPVLAAARSQRFDLQGELDRLAVGYRERAGER